MHIYTLQVLNTIMRCTADSMIVDPFGSCNVIFFFYTESEKAFIKHSSYTTISFFFSSINKVEIFSIELANTPNVAD